MQSVHEATAIQGDPRGSVFITGASRGLGLELAREFGRRRFAIAFCGRDPDEVGRAERDLRQRGNVALGLVADVSRQDEIRSALAAAAEQLGAIWALVNCAGTIVVGPRDEMTIEDYRQAMDTHFWGPLYAVETVVPAMRARGSGRIVNITSVGGRISVPHLLPYAASKFALVGYSEGLRAELYPDGVRVTTVVPGLMRTGSQENAEFKGQNQGEYAWFSTLDSLPVLSVDVTTAAKQIADATERGDAELTISLPAKLASLLHGLFPAFVCDALGVLVPLLPGPGGIGKRSRRGKASHSKIAPSFLTESTQERAVTQNELPA